MGTKARCQGYDSVLEADSMHLLYKPVAKWSRMGVERDVAKLVKDAILHLTPHTFIIDNISESIITSGLAVTSCTHVGLCTRDWLTSLRSPAHSPSSAL